MTTDIVWNEVSSTLIPKFLCRKVTRQLLGTNRGVFVDTPGRPGSWFFTEQRGRRSIRLDCVIIADSPADRRDTVELVADWLDVNTQARLQISTDPGVYYEAVLVSIPNVEEWVHYGEFTLEFAAEPFAYDNDASSVEFEQTIDDSWTYDFGLIAFTYPVIEITNDGPDALNGWFLQVNGAGIQSTATLPVGETVTINSIGMAVLAGSNDDVMLTGVYEPGEALMAGVTGEFPTLIPGSNSFEINAEYPSTVTIRVNYRKRSRR